MGLGFNWFKEYEIKSYGESFNIDYAPYFSYEDYYISFLDGGSTSHSYHNVSIVQDLVYEVSGKYIPRLPYELSIDSKDYKLELIEPTEMLEICNKILSGTKVDEIGMRDRFEWFKQYSSDGYYIAYDCE